MYRIDNSTAVPHASGVPTPAVVGPNVGGYFTKGNPGGGVAATIVDDDWANAMQEEVAAVIEGAGITLSKTVRNQLFSAILSYGPVGQCRLAVASSTSITPVRVGLTPTSGSVTDRAPASTPAARKKAAEEISPGTSRENGRRAAPPSISATQSP